MAIIIVFIMSVFITIMIAQYMNIRKLKWDNEIEKRAYNNLKHHFEMREKLSECDSSQVDALEKKNAALLLENMQLKSAIDLYRKLYGRTNNTPQISKDTVDAVRYAMKHAHPDNGGSAEDFDRFKKCYEELVGR